LWASSQYVLPGTSPRFGMAPAMRDDSRYPGVPRKISPGSNIIARPDTASTMTGWEPAVNLNAHAYPSNPGTATYCVVEETGSLRSTDVLLMLGGSRRSICLASVTFALASLSQPFSFSLQS